MVEFVRRVAPPAMALGVGSLAFWLSVRLHSARAWRLAALLTAALAASHVLDFPMALRLGIARVLVRIHRSKTAPLSLTDECTFVVGPEAIDRNHHMNNARYARVANIARRTLLLQTGIADFIESDARRARAESRAPLNLVIVAQAIRYRRELRVLQRVVVRSSVRWWDEPSTLFVEHRFVTHAGTQHEFVNAVQLVKYRLLGVGSRAAAGMGQACSIVQLLAHARAEGAAAAGLESPPEGVASSRSSPRDVETFAEYERASSTLLRAELGLRSLYA